jgi:luciferase-type oxidoreductase
MQADTGFNRAHAQVLAAGHLTLGLMTPLDRAPGQAGRPGARAGAGQPCRRLGVAALWTRDVPLIIPQGIAQGSEREAAVLDEPFVWLAALAIAAPQAAIGTAAAVLPLRHPLHLAKAAWSLDRLSGGHMILGLGSGDRPEKFAAFGVDEGRDALFRERWALLRAALSPEADPGHAQLLEATAGYAPTARAARAHPLAGGRQCAPVAAVDRSKCRRLAHLPPRGSAPAGPNRTVGARARRACPRRP